jgi:hypothetical protein
MGDQERGKLVPHDDSMGESDHMARAIRIQLNHVILHKKEFRLEPQSHEQVQRLMLVPRKSADWVLQAMLQAHVLVARIYVFCFLRAA